MKNYIVFDLEWNQSSSGKEASLEHFPFEIFEIGAVKLDSERRRVSEFHRLIRPFAYRKLHPIISEVTHMTEEELEKKGQPFSVVMEEFLEWCGADPAFCTWGSMDLTELQRNMVYHGMEIPFQKPLLFYDVQKLFSIQFSDGKTRDSLESAVEKMGFSADGSFHRALEDAEYTAKVFGKLDFERVGTYVSVDYYRVPETKKEEFTLEFPEYSKFVSRTFAAREDAMADKRVTDVICYKCHRMLRKKIRWFSYGQRYYLCLAACPEHGFMKAKIRMKKTEDGEVFAVRTQKLVDETAAAWVAQKKQEVKLRHAERMRAKRGANHKKES